MSMKSLINKSFNEETLNGLKKSTLESLIVIKLFFYNNPQSLHNQSSINIPMDVPKISD